MILLSAFLVSVRYALGRRFRHWVANVGIDGRGMRVRGAHPRLVGVPQIFGWREIFSGRSGGLVGVGCC